MNWKKNPDIICLGCNKTVYSALKCQDELYKPWDWDRQLCGECDSVIPEHIPKEQVLRFAITLRERKRKDERNSYIGEEERNSQSGTY